MTSELLALYDQFRRDDSFETAFKVITALRRLGRANDSCDFLKSVTARDLPPVWSCQFAVCAHELGLNELSIALFDQGMPGMTGDSDRMVCMADLAAAKFASGLYHQAHPIFRTLREPHWLAVQHSYAGGDYWWRPFAHRLLLHDQPIDGRRIMVVHDEGGIGDLFQMIRYVDELTREGASRVYVVAPASAIGLIATKAGVEVYDGVLPEADWDFFCNSFALFARYQAHPFSPHWDDAYLAPDTTSALPLPALSHVRGSSGRPKVGIVWRSATTARHEPFRSMSLSVLAPVLDYDGVDWFSLQVGDGPEDELTLMRQLNIDHIGGLISSFGETAHVLQNLDLLISIDSAPVHLAGSLGCPVWVLLCQAPDYRWFNDARFTPWYSSARLFRQEHLGDWTNVIEDLSRKVRGL
jgi:hypothetical protein